MNEVRVAKLRGEIERWQDERIRVRAERQLGTVGP